MDRGESADTGESADSTHENRMQEFANKLFLFMCSAAFELLNRPSGITSIYSGIMKVREGPRQIKHC